MIARFAFGIVIAGNYRLRMMSTVNRYPRRDWRRWRRAGRVEGI